MDSEVPKRMLKPGSEPLVSQINNSCRLSILPKLKQILPREYDEVKQDPVFGKIIAMHENGLNYSARVIHSFLCRQLVTDKIHELWFLFANRPLRFSLQEFYAVTGLRFDAIEGFDFDDWEEDDGFWSKFLKRDRKLSLHVIWKDLIGGVNQWRRVDRVRLVYICILAGVLLARGEKAVIPNQYIKVVMDVDKFRAYPWGVKAFDLLLDSVHKTRDNFFIVRDSSKPRPKSYVLDGFSYALQVWGMEAIPLLGKMLGEKIDDNYIEGARCANWSGAAKVSYEEINHLENTFQSKDIVHAFISWTGNCDVVDSVDYCQWPDEMVDERVDYLKMCIRKATDWANFSWDIEGSISASVGSDVNDEENRNSEDTDEQVEKVDGNGGSSSKKRTARYHGAEKRKLKFLCERSTAATQGPNLEEMKSWLSQMIQESFAAMEEKLGKRIEDKIDKLENEVTELKESLMIYEVANKMGETSKSQKPKGVDSTREQPVRVVRKKKNP